MIGQDASTPATEYGPQWMNIPNLASRCQASWSAMVPSAKHERARTARATAAILARNILLLCGILAFQVDTTSQLASNFLSQVKGRRSTDFSGRCREFKCRAPTRE